ncbi:hypothetical protein Dsin_020398 [Dipteronia sinensis]|uniref:Legume lectin domain-containing protein n=1 Tax=Dipteronia sinensis TaxID=43782 RepID=A0AAE0E3G3_9ROSI|nr:hypothetical protein Dsin_020398 [Dipteronia sinensis]
MQIPQPGWNNYFHILFILSHHHLMQIHQSHFNYPKRNLNSFIQNGSKKNVALCSSCDTPSSQPNLDRVTEEWFFVAGCSTAVELLAVSSVPSTVDESVENDSGNGLVWCSWYAFTFLSYGPCLWAIMRKRPTILSFEISNVYHPIWIGWGAISDGLLILTNSSRQIATGHAFYPLPIKFNSSSSQSFSFSTNFVFAIVPDYPLHVVDGMAFVISPSMDFTKAFPLQYLGLFNMSNYGSPENHILAVELDGSLDFEFGDIEGNHVGIDVNSLTSIQSAPAAYFSDAEGKNKSLVLSSGDPIQIWIDYSNTEKIDQCNTGSNHLPTKTK